MFRLLLLMNLVLVIVIVLNVHNNLFSVQVSQEKLVQYIHFNRLENRMLIDQLRKEIDIHHPTPLPPPPGQVQVLVRKEVGNPADFFDKTFAEYQAGFSANGLLKQQLIQSLIMFKERAGLALTTSTD